MQLSFFCGTAHFWPDRWVGRWGRRILPGRRQDADAPQEGDLRLREHRAAAHGAAAEAKAGRTPAEPTPVPMQKGNTHGRALYACYAFLPLLKNAPMTSMTKNTIR